MGSWRLDDRGGSAVEAALLMAAVAIVMVPALFLLGRAVDSAFSKPCDELSNGSCAASRGGGPGGGGASGSGGGSDGGGSAAQAATRDLESWVTSHVSTLSGSPRVSCEELETPTPPPGSTATCTATFTNGDPDRRYVVEWTSEGTRQLRDG